MNVLITGSHGLVGSALVSLLSPSYEVLTPLRAEMDLLRKETITTYLSLHRPNAIILAAAYVNAGAAENERGDTNGVCYQTNVLGTKYIVESGEELGIPTVYISTGSVFHGTDEHPGPFAEDAHPESDPEKNNWYGYTKYLGEMSHPSAIIRISHPIIPETLRIKEDYLHKILRLYENHTLHPLFPDQLFPVTSITDLAESIRIIIEKKHTGVFHAASPDLVSPYELTLHFLEQLGKPIDDRIKKMSIEDFYALGNSPLRFSKYSALSPEQTMERLPYTFKSWKESMSQYNK